MYKDARNNKPVSISLVQIVLAIFLIASFYVLPLYLISTPKSENQTNVYTAQALKVRDNSDSSILGLYTNINDLPKADQSKLLLSAGLMLISAGMMIIVMTLLYQSKRTNISKTSKIKYE